MRRSIVAITAAALAALPAPAMAHWVSMGGGEWIDTESIRRAGEITYFRSAWYAEGYVPAGLSEPLWEESVYNCRTNTLYGINQSPNDAGVVRLRGSAADQFRRLLCH
jgi:hypothetical protein